MTTKPVNNPSAPSPLVVPSAPVAPRAADVATGKEVKARDTAGTAARAAGQGGSVASNVQISDGAKARAEAHQKALDIARRTPDVREDKVAALKAQIQGGTYQVDSGKIADGMLREAIKDHLAETEER